MQRSALRSQKLRGASCAAQALYFRLLLAADAYGTMDADPEQVRAAAAYKVDHLDVATISTALDELETVGLIGRWNHDGDDWLHIIGFDDNQLQALVRNRGKRSTPIPPDFGSTMRDYVGTYIATMLPDIQTVRKKKEEREKSSMSPPSPRARVRRAAPAQLDFHIQRLIDGLSDADDRTANVIRAACKGLSPADIESVREIVMESTTVKSPSAMAVALLKDRNA